MVPWDKNRFKIVRFAIKTIEFDTLDTNLPAKESELLSTEHQLFMCKRRSTIPKSSELSSENRNSVQIVSSCSQTLGVIFLVSQATIYYICAQGAACHSHSFSCFERVSLAATRFGVTFIVN